MGDNEERTELRDRILGLGFKPEVANGWLEVFELHDGYEMNDWRSWTDQTLSDIVADWVTLQLSGSQSDSEGEGIYGDVSSEDLGRDFLDLILRRCVV